MVGSLNYVKQERMNTFYDRQKRKGGVAEKEA